jgi:hypothetical protein
VQYLIAVYLPEFAIPKFLHQMVLHRLVELTAFIGRNPAEQNLHVTQSDFEA